MTGATIVLLIALTIIGLLVNGVQQHKKFIKQNPEVIDENPETPEEFLEVNQSLEQITNK